MPSERDHTERFNARIPKLTANQIERLADKLGLTKTQLLIVAVDRMAQQELADEFSDNESKQ